MPRGRPPKSEIRQNLIDMLFFLGESYGYELFKLYKEIFPRCSNEVIYYHLKKGAELGDFAVKAIKKEQGEYSWGTETEKIIYCLGPNAKPRIDERVKKHIDERKR